MNKKKIFPTLISLLAIFAAGCETKNNSTILETSSKSLNAAVYEKLGCTTEVRLKTNTTLTLPPNASRPNQKLPHNPEKIRGKGPFQNFAKANPDDVFIHGFKDDKSVALTFDDGPDKLLTPKLLDILKEYNVKASFFVIGCRIDNAPEVLKRADKEGHLILNHSYNHPEFKKTDNEKIKKELQEDEDKIYSVIGKKPAIVRPPYGSVDQRVIDTIRELNYKTALWSIDTLDWHHMDKHQTVKSVLHSVKNEDIILMHMTEAMSSTLEAVPEIITNLKAQGYNFVTLDEMLDVNAYK